MNKEAYQQLSSLIELAFSKIGPENYLDSGGKNYIFEDDMKMEDSFVRMGYDLHELVLKKILSDQVNGNFAYQVFEQICGNLYHRIKQRNLKIENVLKNYLIQEDFVFAKDDLENILKKSKGQFKLILVTDLLELDGIETCEIGNVSVKQINENNVNFLPEKIKENTFGLAALMGNPDDCISRQEFLKKHASNVLLETTIGGYHLKNEQSLVFDIGLQRIESLFSYLLLCEVFFQNIKQAYPMVTRALEKEGTPYFIDPVGLQEYYVQDTTNSLILDKISTQWTRIILANKSFVLSEDLLNRMKKSCCLKQFNEISKENNGNEIYRKIGMSFTWFHKALLEKDPTDRAINLFICLETLLSMDSDFLTSHTNEIAENLSIMMTRNIEKRCEYKKKFKSNVYPLRNKIFHHGGKISSDSDWKSLYYLKIFVVWAIIGILQRKDEILQYGADSKAMREYFDRKKLSQP